MIRGTTPTHIFTLPFEASTIAELRVTYEQNGEIVLEKTETDCELSGNSVKVKLSQEDTLKFAVLKDTKIQLKIKNVSDEVLATTISSFAVDRVLNEEVL